MQPTEPLHVHLPKDMVAGLREAVATGQYSTTDEIAYEALAQWQLRRKLAAAELRRLWDEGIASGRAEPFTLDELLAEIRNPPGGV